ncbi:MAG TPA: gamma-glutamyl-gamma-aminobutyrate hydrolase family protein [Anaerolineae bacterium]|nr:gamma-glutamyl-gamma-aminobutyrate hydrolase family protein [Anaerolineae bacterium]
MADCYFHRSITLNQKPLIGITAHSSDPDWIAEHVQNYINAIQQADGTPLVLAPGNCLPPAEQIARLDGLLLSGGPDVHPRYYGEEIKGSHEPTIDVKRDEMELRLIRAALAVVPGGIPVLGICRGIQSLNVGMGGQLIQHLPEHQPKKQGVFNGHRVRLVPGTRLATILACGSELEVNSYHHQGINEKRLAPGLVAAAYADPDNWLVEGCESVAYAWVIGVQWHPERLSELPPAHARLFESFVAAAYFCKILRSRWKA